MEQAQSIGTQATPIAQVLAPAGLAMLLGMFLLIGTENYGLAMVGVAVATIPHCLYYAALAGILASRFPARVRYTSISLCYQLCGTLLKKRALDKDPNAPLALALGASIEVEASVLERTGRGQGEAYLRQQLQMYSRTSIRDRIQKNINLLSMVGKPAPALRGAALPPGKVTLLFFWAHWCPDCKGEAAVIHKLKEEFGAKGFAVVSPTQHYGYAANGDDATPEAESRYIEQIRQRYYSGVVDAPALVNEENFKIYGASTTPTLVLVDRKGIVRMYHPGAMPYVELRARIAALL